ncbi:PLAT/LH2 domain-containing protein [Paenibacillus kribbensis]|uniref:PLAT/LH2 domain-containing protein n=1 Tax=Paenibacillus kribbensis TaxID=172713 RepID=UPI002DBD5FAF|nr:PLAT/LH2 domain-containing protein [Paenibacillus kribbensis]MEC0233754.1 PLAT/LH2 domain-containing protein [Paenibacillus kribbensis]
MKKLLSVAATSILAVTMVTPAFASEEVSDAVVPAQSTDATYNIESVTPFANVTYNVTITTKNEDNAGTNSNLSIILYSATDSAGPYTLTGSYEQGDSDTTAISSSNIGNIRKVTIRTDGSGYKPGWRIGSVHITNPDGSVSNFGAPNRWLGDGGTADEITLVKTN